MTTITMAKLKNITRIVQTILEKDKKARNDDNYLYLRVICTVAVLNHTAEIYGVNVSQMTVTEFFLSAKTLKIPGFETVRRARQKVQAKFPELSGNEETTEARAECETVFREYAKKEVV